MPTQAKQALVVKAPGEEACYHLYYSEVVDNTGRQGGAIALSEAAQAALLAWVPISSRRLIL